MANSNSAEKRNRQNIKRNLKNRVAKKRVRSSIKSFMAAVTSNDKEVAGTSFKTMVKLLDTAVGKGIFHKNTIARKKSRMHKLLNSIGE